MSTRSSRSVRLLRAALVLGLAVMIAPLAAGEGQEAGYQRVRQATLRPGDAIPAPRSAPILTVLGAQRAPRLEFDRDTLERIGLIRYTSRNHWYDQPVTYEGVPGSALLAVVGVPPGATRLRARALNDYVVHIPLADFRDWPVMFALKLDGQYLTVKDKGPIWVVYPNHLDPHLGGMSYQGRWIWQLREIRFE
jgi:hypothetical protein